MSEQTEPTSVSTSVYADASIDRLIVQVCRMHHRRAHDLLEELGLYRGQPRLLRALWERQGRTHSELAERLHVQPATITKMLQRMQEAGFVQRRRDTEDQRVSRVYLTAAGREIQERVRQVWRQLEDEALAGFTPEERALLHRFLVQIRDNFALVHACKHASKCADKHASEYADKHASKCADKHASKCADKHQTQHLDDLEPRRPRDLGVSSVERRGLERVSPSD